MGFGIAYKPSGHSSYCTMRHARPKEIALHAGKMLTLQQQESHHSH